MPEKEWRVKSVIILKSVAVCQKESPYPDPDPREVNPKGGVKKNGLWVGLLNMLRQQKLLVFPLSEHTQEAWKA